MGRVRVNRPEVDPYVRSLAPTARKRVRESIRALVASPRPKGRDVKLLATEKEGARFFRLRIGPHRVVYSVHGEDVYVHRAFHRSEGYGWLERL